MNQMPPMPKFLKRIKGEIVSMPRAPRRPKLKLPPVPKSWKNARKVRVLADAFPGKFPCGYRTVLAKYPKTSRGKIVQVREFPCYSSKVTKVARDVFERAVRFGEQN